MMRHAITAFFAAFAFLSVGLAQAQTPPPAASPGPPPAENLAAARELVMAIKATDQLKTLLPIIMQALKPVMIQRHPDADKDFDAILPIINDVAAQRSDELVNLLATVYARNFSVDELHDITAF